MVIDPGNNINSQNLGANKTRQQQTAKADAPDVQDVKNTSSPGADSVSLSNASRAIASLESRVLEAPDIDASRIAEIKQSIDSGNYQIDAKVIAEKITIDDAQIS